MYEHPAVVLGSSQRRAASSLTGNVPIVTRDSGGGAVPVGPWLVGASVVLPVRHPLVTASLVESYRWIGEVHCRVLNDLGVRADPVSPAELRAAPAGEACRIGWACFGSLSPWEVTGRGRRKLVGLAQVRRRTGVLFVAGTLVAEVDWRALAASMGRPAADGDRLAALTTNCESELGRRVPPGELSAALHLALRARIT